jgi:hypothetical protein
MTIEERIKKEYGCGSRHVRSEQVHESFGGRIAWQGIVEVFDLIGYPEAKRAYAWIYSEGNQDHTVIVLEKPPVDSAQSAVKVAIASKARP